MPTELVAGCPCWLQIRRISDEKQLSENKVQLYKAFEAFAAKPTDLTLATEALPAAALLLLVPVSKGDEAKWKTFTGAVLDCNKQLFASDKFLQTMTEAGWLWFTSLEKQSWAFVFSAATVDYFCLETVQVGEANLETRCFTVSVWFLIKVFSKLYPPLRYVSPFLWPYDDSRIPLPRPNGPQYMFQGRMNPLKINEVKHLINLMTKGLK